MKKICIIALLCIVTLITVNAQFDFTPNSNAAIITYQYNGLCSSDTVEMNQRDYQNPGNYGTEQIWDFSNSDVRSLSTTYYCLASDSSIAGWDKEMTTFYRQTNDSLLVVRQETNLSFIDYKKPLLSMSYPLAYGDSISSSFYGEGMYCGRFYIRRTGVSTIEGDGLGTLIRSEGDTIKNVLRVYSLISSAIMQSTDSCFTDADSLKHEITERFQWYALGVRRPLYTIESTTLYNNFEPYATRMTAYSYDSAINIPTNTQDDVSANTPPEIFHYSLSVNQNQVTIHYSLDESTSVRILVADVMGMTYKNNTFNLEAETGQIQLDCNDLRRGRYIVYINVGGTVYNNKIIIR